MTTLRSQEATQVATAAPAPQRPARDPWFDNVKMLLITLVVVGHSWAQLPQTTTVRWAYDFVYAFHMPAFVLVTGYLSRSMTWEPKRLWSLVRTVAVPYFVFEAALALFRDRVGGVELPDLFKDPHWPLWFLVALFFWRLATPLLLRVPRLVALAAAVALSLSVGYVDGVTLDLQRMLGFLPFFVLGLRLERDDWDRLRARVPITRAVAGVTALLVVARFADQLVNPDFLYYNDPYDALGAGPVSGPLTRLALLAVGVAATACVVLLVPRTRTAVTAFGSATLIVYLFHGFFVLSMRYSDYPDWVEQNVLVGFTLTTLAAAGLAFALAAPPVARRLTPVVDPLGAVQAWRERRREAAPTSA